jgi:hypothetical protein
MMLENRKQYWSILSKDTGNALINHLNAFGYYDVEANEIMLSPAYMYVAFVFDLGIDDLHARLIVSASIGLAKKENFDGVYFSLVLGFYGKFPARRAAELMHPNDTGFFERHTSNFNADRFQSLNKFSIKDENGEPFISLESFFKCQAYLADKDWKNYYSPWKDKSPIDRLIGSEGNKGEVGFLFGFIPTRWINDTPHARISDLEIFYRNTSHIIDAVRSGDLRLAPKLEANKATSSTAILESLSSAPKKGLFDKALDAACGYAKGVTDTCPSYFNKHITLTSPQIACARLFASSNNTCPTPSPLIGATAAMPKIGS